MDASTAQVADQLIEGLHSQIPTSNFQLKGIEVLLGAVVDLDALLLQAALEARLPGVEVQVTLVEVLMHCTDCGAEYPPDEHPCPVCGSPNATVIHGHELEIVRAWGETV